MESKGAVDMGVWGWVLLLAATAALATAAQFLFFSKKRASGDSDWIFIAAGAVVGGFTAQCLVCRDGARRRWPLRRSSPRRPARRSPRG